MSSKYHNRKAVVDGITFDSITEAEYYIGLKLLLRDGAIKDIEIHPKFLLQPAYVKNGKKIRPIYYEADFAYFDIVAGKNVVVDVKGCKTDVYKLKKKLFEYRYDLTITEVKA